MTVNVPYLDLGVGDKCAYICKRSNVYFYINCPSIMYSAKEKKKREVKERSAILI